MNNSVMVRNQLIAKRNDMIQQSRLSLTLNQTKAVSYILSKIKKGDSIDTIYEFDCNEFRGVMRLKKTSYADIRATLQAIADQSMFIRDESGKDILVRWLNIVHMEPGTGKIQLSIHEDMAPYVFNLIEQQNENGEFYTTYTVHDVSLMNHVYSPRIFELLKSYAFNNKQWRFELGTRTMRDLQYLIARVNPETGESEIPKSWSSWAVFERDVIAPAKQDINKYSEMKIDYKVSKIDFKGIKQRRNCTIEFVMLDKTKGEKAATESIINEAYKDIDNDEQFQQISFAEFFKEDEEQRLREELAAQEEDLERRKEISVCPTLLEEYPEFTDDEINALYSAALKHIQPGLFSYRKSNLGERELWVVDYVSVYYDKIKATNEETKTSFFRRLLDNIKHDYDNVSLEINGRYER